MSHSSSTFEIPMVGWMTFFGLFFLIKPDELGNQHGGLYHTNVATIRNCHCCRTKIYIKKERKKWGRRHAIWDPSHALTYYLLLSAQTWTQQIDGNLFILLILFTQHRAADSCSWRSFTLLLQWMHATDTHTHMSDCPVTLATARLADDSA